MMNNILKPDDEIEAEKIIHKALLNVKGKDIKVSDEK